ncbi:2-succinyl-6-hydroxy-2, 4-cyclohexadiene-1-carboxylate synthase [bacterium MnTg02]|nr:2-succinyl-6-hydroxy-2, 4-cyclohexadiene-1-carboxylate synthase [bacterium MnTg02]
MTDEKLQFLDVDGDDGGARRLAYLQSDGCHKSPGIIWLPGFNSDMVSTKASMLADWAARSGRRILRFDYSGHGQSEGQFETATVSQWLEDCRAVIERLAEGPQILIGSSMGGWLALLALRGYRTDGGGGDGAVHFSGAILIAPAWDMTETLMWNRFPQDVRRTIQTDGIYYRPSAYGDGPYPITKKLIEDGRRHLIGTKPFDPGCPIRILHGRQDPDVPWEHSLKLLEQLDTDDAVLSLIKDGDHRLSRPQDLRRLLAEIESLS